MRVRVRGYRFARHAIANGRSADYRSCLMATAAVLELPPIGSSHAQTSCLYTGRHRSGQELVHRSISGLGGSRREPKGA